MTKDFIDNLLCKDGEAYLFKNVFSKKASDDYFSCLQKGVLWKQEPIIIYGKEIMQPRLTAWYGDQDKNYHYSGIKMRPHPWSDTLKEIKESIEKISSTIFTNALLNQYRDERDSVGWHRDNELELGANPIIGSVSLGADRIFKFQHMKEKNLKTSIELSHGSFLLMRGKTQQFWKHCVPKVSHPVGPRINITFRVIKLKVFDELF